VMKSMQPDKTQFELSAALATLALALVLAIPTIASHFTDHLARSSWEKRPLTPFPTLWNGTDGGFFADLELFIDDHIGLALELNQVYRKLKFNVYRDSPMANILLGEDEFIFLGSHSTRKPYNALNILCVEAAQRPVEPSIRGGIAALTKWAMDLEMRPSFAIFPSKPVLYPEKLPSSVPPRYQSACRNYSGRPNLPSQLAQEWPDYIYYPLQHFAELKEQPYFYPPASFHANGQSAHEFARGFLSMINIDVGPAFDLDPTVKAINADMKVMGFTRQINIWTYRYRDFGVVMHNHQPEWIKSYYPRARDFAHFQTRRPASSRTALLLSNSFGSFVAPHLAPGFKDLYHINVNYLAAENTQALLTAILENYPITDLIYLAHDGGLMNNFKLNQLSNGLQGIVAEKQAK